MYIPSGMSIPEVQYTIKWLEMFAFRGMYDVMIAPNRYFVMGCNLKIITRTYSRFNNNNKRKNKYHCVQILKCNDNYIYII